MNRSSILTLGFMVLATMGCGRVGSVSINNSSEPDSVRVEPAKLSSRDTSVPARRSTPVRNERLEVTEAQFRKHVTRPELVLVKFGATWCPPCRLVDAELNLVAANSHTRVAILKVDIDDYPDLASKYGVGSIPRIFLIHDGKKIGDWTGFQSAEKLQDAINAARTTAAPAGDVHANPYAT